MKKLLFVVIPLIITVFVFIGCDGSSQDESVVRLDGPILETFGSEGNLEFNGAVINTANYPVKSVYVVILLRDATGEVIETNNIIISPEDSDEILYPQESEIFSVPFNTNASEVFSKDVEIYYELVN